MPKTQGNCKTHELLMGIGIIVFAVILWLTSSEESLAANLNWPGAFLIIGILCTIKSWVFPCCKE